MSVSVATIFQNTAEMLPDLKWKTSFAEDSMEDRAKLLRENAQ